MKTANLNSVLGINKLEVRMNETPVGTLALTSNHVVAFQYNQQWIASGFSISPFTLKLENKVYVPKYQPFEGLFGVFNDCLPDGWGRLLTDRMLKAHGINPNTTNSLEHLALTQSNAVGALNFRPCYADENKIEYSNFDELASECKKIFDDIDVADIDKYYKLGGSSGGARPKVNVLINGEHWIVKFGSSLDASNIGEVEFKCNELAAKCGIEVAEHKLIPSKICSGIFASKRFDYCNSNGTAKKFHVVSAGGLLEASHRVPAFDYDSLLKLTLVLTQSMAEVEKMFQLMVFNVAIGNKDDHAKNFSYYYDEAGSVWHLCPAYDLTPNAGMAGEHTTTVNGKGKNITQADMLEVAKGIGISNAKAKTLLERVFDVVGK